MSKITVMNFTISLDGFGAGADQSIEIPLGAGGEELHTWMFPTKRFRKMGGHDDGTEGIDNGFVEKAFENVGAWIMGRNMFGPVRGAWPDDNWTGWWGKNPPYHVPVFVLTHHERQAVTMEGGTVFNFVTGGIEAALEEARKATNGKDVRIGGGVSTIRQFLQRGYIDELHLAVSPRFLGSGEHLFSGIDMLSLGYHITSRTEGELATHMMITKD
ncbi:dihydrofolate reductase family protein [Pedobacter heparinus]|uniref:dihydrofolate reductase family protein n=1 Tax=Pedobacter heparinus TaxID=984 RepID=UPI00292FEE51|nr:dihydrofolate reductase family protein [Pedobacter heparinus]